MKTIDTRDLYLRQQELQALKDAFEEAEAALKEATDDDREELEVTFEAAESEYGSDEEKELKELDELESEISEFRHGVQMIPEDDFEDYARELADDIGAVPKDASWPCTCIDWEQAADELKGDYTEVEYQGDTYLVRA